MGAWIQQAERAPRRICVPHIHSGKNAMDVEHKRIRKRLQSMAPRRAIAYIESIDLPPYEAACVIESDVRGKSYCEIAFLLNVSPETVKRYRRRAYQKIADEQKNRA